MKSKRTANFKEKEGKGKLTLNIDDNYTKQLSTPLPKFDIKFKFFNEEEEKEASSFSFKNDLLDKKAYEFIKRKDECLAIMRLNDSIPDENEEYYY